MYSDWAKDFLDKNFEDKAKDFGETIDGIPETKLALRNMGYYMSDIYTPERTSDYICNVRIFQRSTRRLIVDGIAGDKTKLTIEERLKELGK